MVKSCETLKLAKSCKTLKLTKSAIDRATPQSDGKQRLYIDSELRGFGCCVGVRTKTYYVQSSKHGRLVIGHHGVFTLDQARHEARQILARIARGENPKSGGGITLSQALKLTTETLQTKGRSAKTISGYQYVIERYLKDWLDHPLSEITRDDAHGRHLALAKIGKPTADGTLVAFRAVYNRALRGHPELPPNPCINVDFFRVKREKTELPLSQLHVWYKAVAALDNPIRRDYLLFVLHTGQRRTSAAEARWEQVDFKQRVLHIPNPKGGRAFALPLTPYLVKLLRARKKENDTVFGNLPWIFPAESASGHIAEPREEFDGVKWTPHDLRRWFITTTKEVNLHPWDIKLLVNHAMSGVTEGYHQHEVERLRPAMNAVGAKLLALCKGK